MLIKSKLSDQNDQQSFNHMKTNKRNITDPPSVSMDIKELLRFVLDNGVGKEPKSSEQGSHSWSTKELAEALYEVDPSGNEIDIRTIQNWIQPTNQRGVSPKNVSNLARVLGRGDPKSISQWRLKGGVRNSVSFL